VVARRQFFEFFSSKIQDGGKNRFFNPNRHPVFSKKKTFVFYFEAIQNVAKINILLLR
jgi:hypothetical protein